MEIIISILVLAVFLLMLWGVSALTKLPYKSEWVRNGQEDRLKGYPRFRTPHRWIQRYYDQGYFKE